MGFVSDDSRSIDGIKGVKKVRSELRGVWPGYAYLIQVVTSSAKENDPLPLDQ